MKIITQIIALSILVSCSNASISDDAEPKISVGEMGRLLALVTMQETATGFTQFNDTITPIQMGQAGEKVLDSLGVSRADFKQSLAYYEAHPDIFIQVMDTGISYINHYQINVLNKISEYEKED